MTITVETNPDGTVQSVKQDVSTGYCDPYKSVGRVLLDAVEFVYEYEADEVENDHPEYTVGRRLGR
jgi:hypothetical protein